MTRANLYNIYEQERHPEATHDDSSSSRSQSSEREQSLLSQPPSESTNNGIAGSLLGSKPEAPGAGRDNLQNVTNKATPSSKKETRKDAVVANPQLLKIKGRFYRIPKKSVLTNRPSEVRYKQLRFLIHDAPTNENVHLYARVLAAEGCTEMVRTCEPSYAIDALTKRKVDVTELPFEDGAPPPPSVLCRWLSIVDYHFPKRGGEAPRGALAIHCVAGLGRAPLLVAIALVKRGLTSTEAVALVRSKRRGAINARQAEFVAAYFRCIKQSNSGCGNSLMSACIIC